MKKTLAMISALAIAVCSFTACGKDKESSKVSDKELIKAVEKMQETMKDGELEDFLRCVFPDNMVEGMEELGLSSLMAGSLGDMDEDIEFEVREVVKTEDIPEEEIENMEKLYSLLDEVISVFEDEGLTFESLMSGDVDDKVMEELQEKFSYLDDAEAIEDLDIDVTVQIQDAKKVTFAVESDGEEDEEEIPMYKVKGEGWKIEVMYIALMDYAEKVKTSKAASTAKSVRNAFQTSFVELDEEGISLKGVYVISSDSEKEILAEKGKFTLGGNVDVLMEKAESFFEELPDMKYFAVCVNGNVSYVAFEKDGIVGTYPAKEIICEIDGARVEYETFDPADSDFEDIYKKCLKVIE